MPNQPDASAQIRSFLMSNPGQHCEVCLVKGTALDARTVNGAFRPSRDNPYSFMPAWCSDCGKKGLCVAYAGEVDAASHKKAAAGAVRQTPGLGA